jgi:hypothetical protein
VDSCDATGVHHAALANGTACTLAGQPATRALCLAATCAASVCGDGFVDGGRGEACDGGAGCTAACQLAQAPKSSGGGGCGSPGGLPGLALAALTLVALGGGPLRRGAARGSGPSARRRG